MNSESHHWARHPGIPNSGKARRIGTAERGENPKRRDETLGCSKGSGIAGSQQVWMITMIALIHMIHPDPINIVVFIFSVFKQPLLVKHCQL